jgi:ATP-dependent RNA helicase RhlE
MLKRSILTDFKSLGLAEKLLTALSDENYTTPTPIQAQAIPMILEGSDLLGIAQTGTGKTAAFALPILHHLAQDRRNAPRNGCRVLVLAPTRELAAQIAVSFQTYGRHLGMKVATIFGGVSPRAQRNALVRGIDVLVATPGRLIDHMSAGDAKLDQTEILVLDEADQMLDLGFVPDLRRIAAALPKERQTLFFSATMPDAVNRLASAFLNQPKRVSVTPVGTTATRVSQRVIHVSQTRKRDCLAALVAQSNDARTLVFTRTKRGADRVAKHLAGGGVRVSAIHGNKSQSQRERVLKSFRDGGIDVLVATDIAARGIDIDDIRHVINYELPDVPEAYVHRIGRTARAGASGQATTLCSDAELKQLRDIEKLTRQRIKSEAFDAGPGAPRAPRSPVGEAAAAAPPRTQRAPSGAGKGNNTGGAKAKRRPGSGAKAGNKAPWWERSGAQGKRGKNANAANAGGPKAGGRGRRRPTNTAAKSRAPA